MGKARKRKDLGLMPDKEKSRVDSPVWAELLEIVCGEAGERSIFPVTGDTWYCDKLNVIGFFTDNSHFTILMSDSQKSFIQKLTGGKFDKVAYVGLSKRTMIPGQGVSITSITVIK